MDDELPAESTVVDDAIHKQIHEPRWEESTVSEKGSGSGRRRSGAIAAAVPPPEPDPSPAADPLREDSARVLLDTAEDDRGPSTAVDESVLSNMPTAISPNALLTRPATGAVAAGRLVIIGGNDRGREFVLTARETPLGRGADNAIILTDIAVSRHHVVMLFDGARYGVRDLASGNGTLVNGVRITGEVFLHDGDQLELGNTLMRFEQPGASMMTAPPFGAEPVPAPPPPGLPLQAMPSGIYPQILPQVPTPFIPPPAPLPMGTPSMATFDVTGTPRKKLLLYCGAIGGAVIILVTIAIILSSRPDRSQELESSEAASPALDALLTTMGATHSPEGQGTAPAPAPAPSPVVVPADPAPAPAVAPPAPAPGRPTASVTPPPSRPPRKPPEHDEPKKPKKPEPARASNAEKGAAALYKDRQFERAAAMLRDAAERASGADADRLNALARDYAAVGAAIAKGDGAAAAKPASAMASYQEALRLDARAGKGALAPYLREKLAKIAPRAAMAYLQAGKYEQAKAACDAAVNYGVGGDSTVTKVRNLLELKAKEMYQQGVALQKAKKLEQAKLLWRRVLKIVPADSTWYRNAYQALNKRSGGSVDEDE